MWGAILFVCGRVVVFLMPAGCVVLVLQLV